MSERATAAEPSADPSASTPTVNVEGYLSSATGQGAAARLYAEALDAAGVPVTTTNVEIGALIPGAVLPEIAEEDRVELQAPGPPDVNLLCVNGLELGFFAQAREAGYFERPTVGVWAWETELIPEVMHTTAGLLREIWVYSDWVGENLRSVLDVSVATVSPPVLAPRTDGRLSLELPDAFLFLFVFDLFSTMKRKNPLGLVTAFKRAFRDGEGPVLVLKTMNGARRWENLQRLKQAADGRSDIVIVDRLLDESEKAALYQRCDCYVSLHRGEGFGITAAEAMLLGKPAIATGYSGSRQFMTPENSFLVDYEITAVGDDAEIYPEEGHWAEPSLDHAATLMRQVWENPEEAQRRGELGRRTVEEVLSPAAVGDRARERLEAILA
jgi:glycosyltransferase involved in cell wall biosynthesis